MAILDWTGISAPFRIENGSVARSKSTLVSKSGESPHIAESIRTIIKTIVGEWLTQSYIGSEFRSIVFNLFETDFDTYIEYKLKEAVEEQDERVIVTDIEILRDYDKNKVTVKVYWDINPDIVSNFSNPNGLGGYSTDVDLPTTDAYNDTQIEEGGELENGNI